MEKYLDRKYKLISSENFEDYLKHIEVGFLSRKTALAVSPVAVLSRNGDGSFTFTMYVPFRTTTITFKLDEEFVEERADGVKVKSIMTIDGNKMIQVQIEENGRKSTHARHFTPTILTVTTTCDGWNGVCTRKYELIE